MKMYTIRSVSEEGTYYITRNWKGSRAWFTRSCTLGINDFKTEKLALAKLDKLLSVSDGEYNRDKFTVMQIDTDARTMTDFYDLDIWTCKPRNGEKRGDRYVNFG